MSLVPDYDDSEESNHSSELNSNDDSESNSEENVHKNQTKKILPSASSLLSGDSKPGEVFNNPFKAAESAKLASLEKHVKMVKTDLNIKTINGVKICWNYRKGRCRFGSKCTFAHDSDIQKSAQDIITVNETAISVVNDIPINVPTPKSTESQNNEKRKKRPGLGNSIIPSKKVMTAYNLHKK